MQERIEGVEAAEGGNLPAGAVAVLSGPLPTPAPAHRTRTVSEQKGRAVSSIMLSQHSMEPGECTCNMLSDMIGNFLPNRFCVCVP